MCEEEELQGLHVLVKVVVLPRRSDKVCHYTCLDQLVILHRFGNKEDFLFIFLHLMRKPFIN